ncbi:hypothetical protein GpartN1_g1070.t1 [Galdieria partita]|uniref:Ribosomal protein mS38 C-terminal domain-containing protein n=1 Tax=Galdieria partita TaxID=83374 RepID=A0A9C7UMZ9_9RHOD|nr:hypothetical protein GpartN1_g1070.t1 [Galdieria partita]
MSSSGLFALWKHVVPQIGRLNKNNIPQGIKILDNNLKGASTNFMKNSGLEPENVSVSRSWPFDIRKISNPMTFLWWTNRNGVNSLEGPMQDTEFPLVEVGSVLKKRKKKMNKHKLKRRRKRDRMKSK